VGRAPRGDRRGARQSRPHLRCAVVTLGGPAAEPRPSVLRQRLALLPGLLLLGVVGYAGKLTEQSITSYGRAHQLTLPNIEYVLWAIAFGLIVSNTVGVPKICRAGVDTYEFFLKIGIVLLGCASCSATSSSSAASASSVSSSNWRWRSW
jgi:hypothetical protein